MVYNKNILEIYLSLGLEVLTINRLNEIRLNNYGTPMKIVRYAACDDIDIEFLDDFHFIKKHVTYSNFIRGEIKNPYDKCLYGVGAIGYGKFKVKVTTNGSYTQEYTAWANMLKRCYYQKENAKNNAYLEKCIVCDEWHNYQNFAEWFENHKYIVNERLHVDKDIKNPCCRIYSPKTCLLVPQRINMLFLNKPNKRGLPNGISISSSGYLAKYGGESIGVYSTIEEAYIAHSKRKKQEIIKIANEYKNIIPSDVYDIIVSYEFSIENDKNYKVA